MGTETKQERSERLEADRERRRQLRASEDREFEARSTLRHAGFKLDPQRRFPLAMLEALAGVVDEWGQDADYPDDLPPRHAGVQYGDGNTQVNTFGSTR